MMKMKAQKLGLVLGMNMAVACLVMQGCKAVKPVRDLPPPDVTTVDQPVNPPAQQPTVTGKNPVTISSKSEVNHLELREMCFEIFGQKSSMAFFSCCFRTEQNAAVQILCFHTSNDVSFPN